MKQPASLLLLTFTCLVVILRISGNRAHDPKSDLTIAKRAAEDSASPANFLTERKRLVKNTPKQQHPSLFAQWRHGIRTRSNETDPGYRPNYKVEALLNAKGVKSTGALVKFAGDNQLGWTERGPGNFAGRVRGLLVDPRAAGLDTWFAGSVGGGVWKTENAGVTWVNLTQGLPNLAFSTLAWSVAAPDIIYAGTGEGFFNVDQIHGSGIWKSEDSGLSWQQLVNTANLDFQNVTRMVVDPADPDLVLVSTSTGFNAAPTTSGIHRSDDGGLSWAKVLDTGVNPVQDLVADPTDFDLQYATVHTQGVVKSGDRGVTWTDASVGIGNVGRMEIAISPVNPAKLFVSSEIEAFERGSVLYVSENRAQSWVVAQEADGGETDWLAGQGWYDNTIACDPFDENAVFVGGVNLWRIDILESVDSTNAVLKTETENTSSLIAFFPGSGSFFDGGGFLGSEFFGTDATEDDFVSIEVRFGPGRSQKAHRFDSTADTFLDYPDVPFEVWDLDNNRQLAAAFRDWDENGVFDLQDRATALGGIDREHLFISANTYNAAAPDVAIANDNITAKNLYGLWMEAPEGNGTSNFDTLSSTGFIRIIWGTRRQRLSSIQNITDGYGEFGGTTKGVHVDHHNLVLVPSNPGTQEYRMVNANDGGVAFSDNKGLTFIQRNAGFNTSQFYGIDKAPGESRYIGGTQDNGSWVSAVDPGRSSAWAPAPSGDGFEAAWHYVDPDKLIESSQFNLIFRSTDGGNSWQTISRAIDSGPDLAPFFTKIGKSKQDPDLIFAIGASGVWRSEHFGSEWRLVPMEHSGWDGQSSFSQIKIHLHNPQIVWTGRNMTPESPLFVSTDGGLTFAETVVFPDVTLGRISGIETHPLQDSTAFALFSFAGAPKILSTSDLGQSWQDISGFGPTGASSAGFPDVAVYSLLVMPFDVDRIWAGTEIGIFESLDGGASWALHQGGFPATAVYEMLIVDDEVVVATHGRGVWTVSLPELAGYRPPLATLPPRILNVEGGVGGIVNVEVELRSAYDSTAITVDGSTFLALPPNITPMDTALTLVAPVSEVDTVSVAAFGFRAGKRVGGAPLELVLLPLNQPVFTYLNDFNEPSNDFILLGLQVLTAAGFADPALHSPHPYPDATELTAILKTPITVANDHSLIEYDDVALVEPGLGVPFGQFGFWDFVVVEGSRDNGKTWLAIGDGYDASFDSSGWLPRFPSGQGDASLFRTHSLDLGSIFAVDETILVRFRLSADANTNGWGWAIDNIRIQDGATSVSQTVARPASFAMAQNFPNPFNPTTTITYTLPEATSVTLQIFNILGRAVRTIKTERQVPGGHRLTWDGLDDSGAPLASGVYLYRIMTGSTVRTRKMTLLK